jgi:hypothetical protein
VSGIRGGANGGEDYVAYVGMGQQHAASTATGAGASSGAGSGATKGKERVRALGSNLSDELAALDRQPSGESADLRVGPGGYRRHVIPTFLDPRSLR